jgi:hypothetical protein
MTDPPLGLRITTLVYFLVLLPNQLIKFLGL